ncbi:MAG: HlyC/CorC family transporter [Bacteroidetes bacterium]|nr:MAG: HlyC/CorC family transporter [Bacteroidota bacterium]TAF92933.1 MAG: HlyC/CorC family transporter [Bacteroidota bacterium]
MIIVYSLVGIAVTLLFIGYFAGIEIAFISANRLNIELKKKQGKRSGIILSKFLEKPSTFLGSCLVGLNIFLVVYGLFFGELLRASLWNPLELENPYLKLAFDTFFSSIIVIILGEFIPKAIYRARADNMLTFLAPVAQFFHGLFFPIANFLANLSEGILKYVFNVRMKETGETFSKIDLENFFQQNKDQDEENQELNTELFENALSLPNVKIRQCLVPRTEIEAIELHTPIAEVREKFIETKLSKLVVYEKSIEDIVGYVHQLDMLKRPTDVQAVLLPIPAVPESMSATDLITKFSKERKSIAWVVDEFGGTSGIVTMEDVLEEIFGEIKDEYDVEEFVEKQISETEYILSGRLELDYLQEKFNLQFEETDSETLSGYIINVHETIPKLKERIIVNNFEFDILNVSDTRIEMVKLRVLK